MKVAKRVQAIQPSATLSINAKAKQLRRSGVRVISFAVGEPDFDTPHFVGQAAYQAVVRGKTRYTPVTGIEELKETIVGMVARDYGLSYESGQVLVSSGAKHCLYNLFQACVDPGDEVLIPSPYWVSYPDLVTMAEGKPVIIPCGEKTGYKLTAGILDQAISPRTRFLILNSPSNPTGLHYTREELQAIARVLLRHEHVAIVSDDIYYRILFDDTTWANLPMVEEGLRERTFIVNGVSKTYAMTGWRIGYLLGNREVIAAAGKIQSQSTSNPCSVSQWAALAAVAGDQECVENMRRIFQERRNYVMERLRELPGVSCVTPDGAFYVFPKVDAYYDEGERVHDSQSLGEYLLEKAHVAVVPGSAFGEDSCIRLSFALSMSDLEEGFDRLTEAFRALEP